MKLDINFKFFTSESIANRIDRFDIRSLIKIKSNVIVLIIFSVISLLLMSGKFSGNYIDGIYEGSSKAIYLNETYYGKTTIIIKDGFIANAEFKILDSSKGKLSEGGAFKNLTGNGKTKDQFQSDLKGIKIYPVRLVKCQELSDLDAVDDASWTYNLFKYAVNEALQKAKKS